MLQVLPSLPILARSALSRFDALCKAPPEFATDPRCLYLTRLTAQKIPFAA